MWSISEARPVEQPAHWNASPVFLYAAIVHLFRECQSDHAAFSHSMRANLVSMCRLAVVDAVRLEQEPDDEPYSAPNSSTKNNARRDATSCREVIQQPVCARPESLSVTWLPIQVMNAGRGG